MKQARLDAPPANMGLKGRMRRFRVLDGRLPRVIDATRRDCFDRLWKLHPTKGWRLA